MELSTLQLQLEDFSLQEFLIFFMEKIPTLKTFLIFWEMELSSPKLKEGTCKA